MRLRSMRERSNTDLHFREKLRRIEVCLGWKTGGVCKPAEVQRNET